MPNDDIRFMGEALRLARKGIGRTAPNPVVGCVIALKGEIIGSGWHKKAGSAHAEVAALKKCYCSPLGATLYVTLEPCNHQGRTAPCTDAIIGAGIKRVVIGTRDKSPKKGVRGMAALRKAGILVELSQLKTEAAELVTDFHKLTLTGLPFVTLKTATTLDGKIATRTGNSEWVSCRQSRRHVHTMRNQSDAILIGAGTALADDPSLTVRYGAGHKKPLRVVLDSRLRIKPSSQLVASAHHHATLIITTPLSSLAKRRKLEKLGVDIYLLPICKGAINVTDALRELGRRGIMRLLVEGGAQLSGALIDARRVDYVTFFIAPKIVGGGMCAFDGVGVAAMKDALQLTSTRVTFMGDDLMIEGAL